MTENLDNPQFVVELLKNLRKIKNYYTRFYSMIRVFNIYASANLKYESLLSLVALESKPHWHGRFQTGLTVKSIDILISKESSSDNTPIQKALRAYSKLNRNKLLDCMVKEFFVVLL